MQYQRLKPEELQALEDEFVKFLVINGIEADQWKSILENLEEVRDRIIEQFSDVVWEASLRKVKYLEKRESQSIFCFACGEKEIRLIRLVSETGPIEFNLNALNGEIKVQRTAKLYDQKRETELFQMIQNGCKISKGELYRKLDC